MKRFLLLLTLLFSVSTVSFSAVQFKVGSKYRLACKKYADQGSVVLGVNHSSTALLYYDLTATADTPDAWWYIEAGKYGGYLLTNASSGEHIYYSSDREEGVAKGLRLTTATDALDAEWTFEARSGNYFAIANVADPSQWFNLRTNGSYLLGTYTQNAGSDNELFVIYDESGNAVVDEGEVGGGDTGDDTPATFTDLYGRTPQGYYWERTGLVNPVVFTTDPADPVLYKIVNLRQCNYLTVYSSTLYQSSLSSEATKFYFVDSDGAVQVYTSDGSYVATSYLRMYEGYMGLTLYSGTAAPSTNLWQISPALDVYDSNTGNDVSGYALCKLTDLATTSTGGGRNQQSSYVYWNDYSANAIGLWKEVDSGSTFVFLSDDRRHLESLVNQGIDIEGGTTAVSFHQAVDTLRLQGKDLVYDRRSSTYFCSVTPALCDEAAAWTTPVKACFKPGFETYGVAIDGTPLGAAEGEHTFASVDCAVPHTLDLTDPDGNVVSTVSLRFTSLPLVEVNVPSCNGTVYTTGTFRVTDPSVEGYDSVVIAAFRYRGATAQGFDKKAYAIKLRDADGNSVDRSYFGLRNDNNWILDAMVVDPACMRNRVSTDLWNDFVTPPYYKDREPKALTGTRGRFVEVFLNGAYHGLYCMTEKIDRKQLKLKKYKDAASSKSGEEEIHGTLYKSSQWSYEVFMGHDVGVQYYPFAAPQPYTNELGVETWAEYELKYPDFEEEAVEWAPLYDAVNLVAAEDQTTFEAGVKSVFDYPVLIDYYLFIEAMLATDNHGKNMFWAVYDRMGAEGDRLTIAPWDMDGVWGINWAGSTSYTSDAAQDFDTFLWRHEHGQLTLFSRLAIASTIDWADDLAARYAQLRQGEFSEDKLTERFRAYADLFAQSGADLREQQRWPSYHKGIQQAVNYITDGWIADRIAYLDTMYGYDPLTGMVNQAAATHNLVVKGGSRTIAIKAAGPATVNVYTVAGQLAKSLRVAAGLTKVENLLPGVYVVNGQKVLVTE